MKSTKVSPPPPCELTTSYMVGIKTAKKNERLSIPIPSR